MGQGELPVALNILLEIALRVALQDCHQQCAVKSDSIFHCILTLFVLKVLPGNDHLKHFNSANVWRNIIFIYPSLLNGIMESL